MDVSVRDSGIGIAGEDQQTIFREYTQLGNIARDGSKGIGLGLALVRRMSELLKLELSLVSAPGEGACFSLKIPAGDPDQIIQLDRELAPEPIQNLDVMVIDDELPILDAMNTLFSDWSCRTRAFTQLADACRTVTDTGYTPDLIITDYRLGEEETGVDAINSLRQIIGKKVPSIIISGDTDPRLLETIHNADFFLLHKPVRAEKLRRVISSVMHTANDSLAQQHSPRMDEAGT